VNKAQVLPLPLLLLLLLLLLLPPLTLIHDVGRTWFTSRSVVHPKTLHDSWSSRIIIYVNVNADVDNSNGDDDDNSW
jgi:hypothetical protein